MTLSCNQRFLTLQPTNAECTCMRVCTEPRICSSTSTTLFFQLRLQPHEYTLLTMDLCNRVTASVITTDTTLGRKKLTLTLLRVDLASWVTGVQPSRPRGDPKVTHPAQESRPNSSHCAHCQASDRRLHTPLSKPQTLQNHKI